MIHSVIKSYGIYMIFKIRKETSFQTQIPQFDGHISDLV